VLLLSQWVDPRRPPTFDEAVLTWLGEKLEGPIGAVLLQVYRVSGVHVTGFLVVAALIYVVLRRWWNDLRLLVTATAGILGIIDLILKPLFDRARPPDKLLVVDGRSFPSGHAAGAVAFYGAMLLILSFHYPHLRRPLAIGACLWVALVWLSTLYARAHWPTDLLAGGAVGLAWLTVCLGFWRLPSGEGPKAR
jgi:undecaprenyl-diphosphatase